MTLFKGKEIKRLDRIIEHNNTRLMKLECEHTKTAYKDWLCSGLWSGGQEVCCDCGKLIRQFDKENEYLKDKHKIMNGIIAKDLMRIAEIEKCDKLREKI